MKNCEFVWKSVEKIFFLVVIDDGEGMWVGVMLMSFELIGEG